MEYKRSYPLELDFNVLSAVKTTIQFKQYDRGTSEILVTPVLNDTPLVVTDEVIVMMYKTKTEVINKVENTTKFNILNNPRSKYTEKAYAKSLPDYVEEVEIVSDYIRDARGIALQSKCSVLSDGSISAIVDNRVLNEVGNIDAELVIYHLDNTRLTSPAFSFSIVASISDNFEVVPTPMVEVPIVTDLGLELQNEENRTILAIREGI